MVAGVDLVEIEEVASRFTPKIPPPRQLVLHIQRRRHHVLGTMAVVVFNYRLQAHRLFQLLQFAVQFLIFNNVSLL